MQIQKETMVEYRAEVSTWRLGSIIINNATVVLVG